MTETDMELQYLRRELAKTKRQRDIFKSDMFMYARATEKLEKENEKLRAERDELIRKMIQRGLEDERT